LVGDCAIYPVGSPLATPSGPLRHRGMCRFAAFPLYNILSSLSIFLKSGAL